MMKSLSRFLFFFAFIAIFEFAAKAQDCATVTLVASDVSTITLTAQVNIVNCRGDATSGFVDASVNTSSSNPLLANSAPLNTKAIGSDGKTDVQIITRPVIACASVTLTFTMRFKVKRIDGTVGPEQIKTVTKTLPVCPFRLDVQVTAVAVTPAEAGQESQVTVTLVNQGSQTPSTGGNGSYLVKLSTIEDTTGFVRNSCSSTSTPTLTGSPQLRPGEVQTLTRRIRFPQAGVFSLRVEVSLFESEDGPTENNSRTQSVTVPLPRPLVCEVAPLTAAPGSEVSISGNWFRRFGTTETPSVRFGGVDAQVITVSPLRLTVRMPDLTCTATGQVSVAVTNAAGATVFPNGPLFPAALSITGIARSPSSSAATENLTISLTNFRPGCRFTVTLEPSRLTTGGALTPEVLSASAGSIIVRIRTPNSVGAYTLKVQTPYGVATKSISLGPQLGSTVIERDSYAARASGLIDGSTLLPPLRVVPHTKRPDNTGRERG